MKTIYEITRPIVTQISIDGDIEIPIGYAYDLYKPEILAHFDHGEILAQWRAYVAKAHEDAFVRNHFEQLVNRAWLRIDMLGPTFWENLRRSNLELVHKQVAAADFGEQLFDALLGKANLLDGEDGNQHIFSVCSWFGYVTDLVHNLEDVTATFGPSDIDFFAANVHDLLTILRWRETIAAQFDS